MFEEPLHPGEVLKRLYLDPLGMDVIAFAKRLSVPVSQIEQLIEGARGITQETACRLGREFNTTPTYWVNLQTNYDVALAVEDIDVSSIDPIVS